MISDLERRDIVECLRTDADYWRDCYKNDGIVCISDSDFMESILVDFGFDDNDKMTPAYEIFDKLADIIDCTTGRDRNVE